jgi:hypothetical protein
MAEILTSFDSRVTVFGSEYPWLNEPSNLACRSFHALEAPEHASFGG